MTPDQLTEFYEDQEKPWWWYRCTHREHAYWYDPDGKDYGCWKVLKEAEGVAIIQQTCLPRVHICVELTSVGSVCKCLLQQEWDALSQPQVMQLVQGMFRELKSLQVM
jgi:hypothetical protein